MTFPNTHPAFKLWLETDEGYVFGPGVYSLLKKIEEKGTLKEAALSIGMSYRYSWGLIKTAEEKLGEPLIKTSKGGRLGGGSTEITKIGGRFIEDFERLRKTIDDAASHEFVIKVEGIVESVSKDKERREVTIKLESDKVTFKSPSIEIKQQKGDKVILILSLSSEQE